MHACRWGHTSEPWRQTPPICIWRVRGRDLQQVAQATMMELPNAVGLTLSPLDRMGGPFGNYKKPTHRALTNSKTMYPGHSWAGVGLGLGMGGGTSRRPRLSVGAAVGEDSGRRVDRSDRALGTNCIQLGSANFRAGSTWRGGRERLRSHARAVPE